MGRVGVVFIVTVVTVVTSGCGRSDDRAATARPAAPANARDQLRPVTMPALGGVEPALQERLRLHFATLNAMRGQANAPDADLARAYGDVGKLLVAAEFHAEAEPFLLNAQALANREMAWPYYLGHVYRLRNQPDRARTAFEAALRARPDYVPALVWLGSIHADAGRAAEAEPLLQEAVALQPDSAAARFALGRVAQSAGNHAEAVAHLEAAIAADPGASRTHFLLATSYRALGDAARAESHLRAWEQTRQPVDSLKGVQIYPADPLMEEIGTLLDTAVSYQARGTSELDRGRYREAAALFRKGLEVAPTDAPLHQNLGTALFLAGDDAAALEAYRAAVRLSPAYARAHFALGVLLESRGDDAGATQHYADAVTHEPSLLDARYGLADALRRSGRPADALPHYQQIITTDTAASQARFGYAMALVRLRRFAEARAALEAAVQAHPEQPGLPHALARVLAAAPDDAVRDGARALAIVETVARQSGPSAALAETWAMALAETGRFKEAVARQRDAMGMVPAGDARTRGRLRQNLQRYEAGTPCRTPWADDDPVHFPRAAAARR